MGQAYTYFSSTPARNIGCSSHIELEETITKSYVGTVECINLENVWNSCPRRTLRFQPPGKWNEHSMYYTREAAATLNAHIMTGRSHCEVISSRHNINQKDDTHK
jgi:hypothetical protein